jgi:glycosyltransferase involved in cell wall biosynthesis
MSAGNKSRVHFTICSRNYLAYAQTLGESLARVDPDEKFVIILCDPADDIDVDAIPNLISAEDLNLPFYWEMALRYDVMEFNTAIKPFVMQHFFKEGYRQAIYLDPDLYLVQPLKHVYDAMRRGATGVLTPHTTSPLDDGHKPSDLTIMQSGIYNLGFGAFTNKPESQAFVNWWADRCRAECLNQIPKGLFVDQKFCDMAPALMAGLKILHHPGYNTAYWNLASRPVTRGEDQRWLSAGEDLHFFHFSGVKPGEYDVFSKHQDRFQVDTIGELKILLTEYLDALGRHGHSDFSKIPYAYNQLADGTRIPVEYRQILNAEGITNESARAFFQAPDHTHFVRPDPEYARPNLIDLPAVLGNIYRRRPDVRSVFGITTNKSREGLIRWFIGGGAEEHGIPKPCVEAVSAQLDAVHTAANVAAPGGGGGPLQLTPSSKPAFSARGAIKAVARAVLPVTMRQQLRAALGRPLPPPLPPKPQEPSPTFAKGLPFGVGLFGYFLTETGVGEGARMASQALNSVDIPHSRHAITTGGVFKDSFGTLDDFDGDDSEFAINLFHINADQTVRLPELIASSNLADRYKIGFWAWELSQFPDAWLPALAEVDEVWAPSAFIADAVRSKTTKPVMVMPHPVVPTPADPARARFGLSDTDFVVLTSLDLNSFFSRKNPQATIAAFQHAFPDQTDVRLVIKMHGGARSFDSERAEIVKWIEDDERIVVIDEVLQREEMDALQESADCFISLHRSEGFGLNIAEMMGRGKPVVSTAYSGSNEFVRRDTAFGVGFAMTAVGKDQYPFWNGQFWAEPSARSAAASLREIYEHSDRAAKIAERGRALIDTEFAPQVIGQRMAERLREIHGEFC